MNYIGRIAGMPRSPRAKDIQQPVSHISPRPAARFDTNAVKAATAASMKLAPDVKSVQVTRRHQHMHGIGERYLVDSNSSRLRPEQPDHISSIADPLFLMTKNNSPCPLQGTGAGRLAARFTGSGSAPPQPRLNDYLESVFARSLNRSTAAL
ncbi:hypothetical protein G4G27_01845 [Sphingomonas sp. So64.6b]|uniref:hypothetical protein n=1 Tax=Sphingomonas sp. So64.6b TaxID=2997354 RepID=UPI0015FFD21E|nr:hypothetical protein [Sphingomonas sp. So64.6b]QNA82893.1 hypothetical protein G4G27_01845 [Sphingomonas sp. So64.6b]